MENFDIKLFWWLLSIPFTIFLFAPYIKDILAKKTEPHMYTWLIWSITMIIATLWWIQWWWKLLIISLWIPTLFAIFTFLLSLKYGTKDITRFDIWVLILAILAIFIFLVIKSALLAVLLVSFIDALWYIPTYRKTYNKPYSETLIFWIWWVILNILMLLSVHDYNLLTTSYILTIWAANFWLAILIILRRKVEQNIIS
jgi:hypothetical protein